MAILDALPKLEVTICVAGEPVEEYDDDQEVVPEHPGPIGEYQAARTVSKYIEAISDREFTINIVLGKGFEMDCPRLKTQVFLDGQEVTKTLISKPTGIAKIRGNRLVKPKSRIINGCYVLAPGEPNKQFLKTFKFCKIETTTDDENLKDIEKDSEIMRKIGEIEMKVYRVDLGTRVDRRLPTNLSSSVQDKVHEKALKGEAKSHSISFGAASQLVEKKYMHTDYLDGKDYPIAIFRFRYRSSDALKSLMILKRTPSPDPDDKNRSVSPLPVDLNNLNETQKRQLARLLQDMNRPRSGSGTPQRIIKRERTDGGGESSQKRRKSGQKTVIDLTDDSDEENTVLK